MRKYETPGTLDIDMLYAHCTYNAYEGVKSDISKTQFLVSILNVEAAGKVILLFMINFATNGTDGHFDWW